MSGAAAQLDRIVQLVADLSRDPAAGDRGVALNTLAARLDTTPKQIQEDLRTLTSISDEGAEWLSSLSVWQEGDRVAAVSRGPYRRPIRFTPDELLAIRVGLALEGPDGETVARGFAAQLHAAEPLREQMNLGSVPGDGEAHVVALARQAMDTGRVLSILYAGERDRAGSARSIEPHQVVSGNGKYYVIAWCRRAKGWRHFRADRVLDALLEDGTFTPRDDHVPVAVPSEVFRAADEDVDEVVVRYGPQVARWLVERFPNAKRLAGGEVEVTHRVVEPAWLVRMVLQYGAEAEVVGPAPYREYVARAVGAS